MFDFDFGDLWDEHVEAELLGAWVYIGKNGLTEYSVSRAEDGRLCFRGPNATGGQLAGALQPQGSWLEARLADERGEAAGIIRLCFAEERKAVLSNFRRSADVPWGKDILAHRAPTPAADSQGGGGAAPETEPPAEPQAPANPWEPWNHWKDEFCQIEIQQLRGKVGVRSHWAEEASKLSLLSFGLDIVKGAAKAIVSGQLDVACLAKGSTFLGFAMFGPVEKKPALEVHYLAVRDTFKRNGCGTMLLAHVRERCRTLGAQHIFATCRWHYLGYYLKLGFYHGQDPGDLYSREARAALHHVRFDVHREFKRPVLVPPVAAALCRSCAKRGAGPRAAAPGAGGRRRGSPRRCAACREPLGAKAEGSGGEEDLP